MSEELTEAGAHKAWGPADFKKGDLALGKYGGIDWYLVVRVNAKSLSVLIPCFNSTRTIPYADVKGQKPGNQKSLDMATDVGAA